MLSLAPGRPLAHEIPARVGVHAFIKPEGTRLHVVVRVPLEAMRDLQYALHPDGTLDIGRTSPLLAGAARQWITDYLELFEDGRPLTADSAISVRLAIPSDRSFADYATALAHVTGPALGADTELRWQQANLDVLIEYPIASPTARFSIRPALAHLGVRTTTVLRFLPAAGGERDYEYLGNPGLVALDPEWYQAAARFVRLGFEHILGGFDHLLFVICLVIPLRQWKALLTIVTAFTVAHSITLIASSLGLAPSALWFPPLVEVLIAVSILYMALENILRPADQLGGRWRMAFAFGLVHGFGFSFALKESLQFGGTHLAASLAAFNVGVEAGQMFVLAIALPLLALFLRRVPGKRMAVIVLSALVAHSAWHWMTDRGATLAQYHLTAPPVDALFWLGLLRAALLISIAGAAAWLFSLAIKRLGVHAAATALSLWLALAGLGGLSVRAQAQRPAGARTAPTTRDGIYTPEQAAQGKEMYLGLCQSCHSAVTHTGAPFRDHWVGRPLSDLFTYILTQMPKSAPGTLAPEEGNLVLAYILKMNGLPAGSMPLSPDAVTLSQIRIEIPAPPPAHH